MAKSHKRIGYRPGTMLARRLTETPPEDAYEFFIGIRDAHEGARLGSLEDNIRSYAQFLANLFWEHMDDAARKRGKARAKRRGK